MKNENPYYLWEIAGKPVKVQLGFAAIDRLAAEAGRGARAAQPAGLEVGGILLGTVTPGDTHLVSIQAVEPVGCEYAYGPNFVLSELDDQKLSAMLKTLRAASGLQPVGFYRSHSRGGLSLSEQDLWLFATHFSSPHDVALIVAARAELPPLAGFFFWENGTLKSDAAYKEFPLDRQELGGGPATEPADVPANRSPEPAAAPEPFGNTGPFRSFLDEGRDTEPTMRKVTIPALRNPVMLATLTAALLLAGGVLGFIARHLMQPAPAPAPAIDPYGLALSVSEYGNNLHLKWNRTAPAIAAARRGFLTISDGSATRPLELGKDQLRQGSVVYRRVTADVRMRLEVFVNDRDTVSETWVRTRPAQ